jgi:hypothetical protein
MIHAFKQLRLTSYNVNVTGGGVLQVGNERVVYQSQTGLFYPASNPSGFITSAQAGGVNSIVANGSNLSGIVTFVGAGTINITTGVGGSVVVSGSATAINTGSFITTGQTGQFYAASNPAGFISTGNADVRYALAANTGNFVTTSSQTSFITSVPQGVESLFVPFPFNFASPPKIQVTVEVTGDVMYAVNVRSRTISGYTALLSDTVSEDGVSLHSFASV